MDYLNKLYSDKCFTSSCAVKSQLLSVAVSFFSVLNSLSQNVLLYRV